jgi:hypothetical protein
MKVIETVTMSEQKILFCDRKSLQEWKVTMKTSNMRTRKFSSIIGKIVMAIVLASMIGGTAIAPAFARDGDRRDGYRDRGRYEHGRRYYQPRPYYYPPPVYAPPPVVYAPAPYQSPGITLVFPFHIR